MGYWKEGDELNNGKLIVEQLLGSGGFGVTYKVKQIRTNKIFALKTLNELAKSKPDFQQLQTKFINEAIALCLAWYFEECRMVVENAMHY